MSASSSSSSSQVSDLIDVTYEQIHSILSGQIQGVSPKKLESYITPRLNNLKALSHPFGKPSDASKRDVSSGNVTLPDGIVLRIDDTAKDMALAVSDAYQICQVQALVLYRCFLFNNPLSIKEDMDQTALAEELVQKMTPFYFSERLSIFRILSSLRAQRDDAGLRFHELSNTLATKLFPDDIQYATTLLDEYKSRTQAKLNDRVLRDRKSASAWAKQGCREQVILLEILFWHLWTVVCSGLLLEQVIGTAFESDFGSKQFHTTLLLDEESRQIQDDLASLWNLITVEILELETLAAVPEIEMSETPSNKDFYIASPASLQRVHRLIVANATKARLCTYVAWTYVVTRFAASSVKLKNIPQSYRPFLQEILSSGAASQAAMKALSFDTENDLFGVLHMLLTQSSTFASLVAQRTGSVISEPNTLAYRAVFKGLLLTIVELSPVELIPDFEGLVEAWVDLFGRSETRSVTSICRQFWDWDWHASTARRAIFDVARSRFPIQPKPLLSLLRSMTGSGFLDTDALASENAAFDPRDRFGDDRESCKASVFGYFNALSTYTMVIPNSPSPGPYSVFEKFGSTSATIEVTYRNSVDVRLPGGSILPRNSVARVLSNDGADYLVLSWQHTHSGWKLLLDILAEFANRDLPHLRKTRRSKAGGAEPVSFSLREIGFEMDGGIDDSLVTSVLDLFRSVMQGSSERVGGLLRLLEHRSSDSEASPPHLVELTTTILEDALSRTAANNRHAAPTHLITSALSVLASILHVPIHGRNVWIYLRYSTTVFGSERTATFSSAALAAERVHGHYPMTLALLHLAQQLFQEASALQDTHDLDLKSLQTEVLLRTMRFVHTQIWVEHQGWKYAQLSDRFEIGRRVSSLYSDVLYHTPEDLQEGSFPALSQTILDLWLSKASSSTVNPLVSSISTGGQLLTLLNGSRRFADSNRLILLLKSLLRLTKLVLQWKKRIPELSAKPSLIEQALCSRVAGVTSSVPGGPKDEVGPIDALASYLIENNADPDIRLEAVRVMSALCSAFAACQPPPTTLVGHLSKPEAVVTAFVRIVQHAYDDISLRHTIWSFMSLAMDKEPALASLLVSGGFFIPENVKGKAITSGEQSRQVTAFEVAREFLAAWEQLWEANPRSLSVALQFMHTIWQHGLEHRVTLDVTREDGEFWRHIISVVTAELGPPPDFETIAYRDEDGARHAEHHSAVSDHAYRSSAKAHAIHILGLDIGIQLHNQSSKEAPVKPLSLTQLEPKLKSEEDLHELLLEAVFNPYQPDLYDRVTETMKNSFPGLAPTQLQVLESAEEREFGDDFAFSVQLLRDTIRNRPQSDEMEDPLDKVEKQLLSLNLNLSLMHTQKAMADAWQLLLTRLSPYMRGNPTIVPILLSAVTTMTYDVSRETREGDMASSIHASRLYFILAALELVWFAPTDKPAELNSFVELCDNLKNVVLNAQQAPIASILRTVTVPFHRPLLQLIYYCAKYARTIALKSPKMTADGRLKISMMIESSLDFVIEALRVVFVGAHGRQDSDLDQDMELLVAVFEQCTKPDINSSSSIWLAKCQETDVLKASFELLTQIDLVGLSDLQRTITRKQPLYAPYILLFHMCLSSQTTSAEKLATEGILTAYSNNMLSGPIGNGQIDVSISELPSMRSPAHEAYSTMISTVSAVVSAMGRRNHFFDVEACGLVQLYGGQIVRALSWNTDTPVTLGFLEELEGVINLFCAIAESAPLPPHADPAVDKVLARFSPMGLKLLQQLNYALGHPNQLVALFEPVTSYERTMLEQDQTTEDVLKRPLVAHLMHRVYKLANGVLRTLISISRAEEVLLSEQEEWPTKHALVTPHSKVVPDEPASIGTLLELSSTACDLLHGLLPRPAGQSLAAPGTTSDATTFAPLTVKEGVTTARDTLEFSLTYASTQLAMWMLKPEFEEPDGYNEMEVEDEMQGSTRATPKRHNYSVSGRLRTGMVGAMATDLVDLMRRKGKDLLKRSETMVGKDVVDITQILTRFLDERILSRTHV